MTSQNNACLFSVAVSNQLAVARLSEIVNHHLGPPKFFKNSTVVAQLRGEKVIDILKITIQQVNLTIETDNADNQTACWISTVEVDFWWAFPHRGQIKENYLDLRVTEIFFGPQKILKTCDWPDSDTQLKC